MNKSFNGYFLIVTALLIAFSGCLNVIRGANEYTDDYMGRMQYVSAYSPAEACKEGYCECFVCKNSTFLFGVFTSFAGGQCKFEPNCDQPTFDEYQQEDSEYALRRFMIGAGPSFADFGEANAYCHTSLTMAVHWLTGNEDKDYELPDAGRAICMLQQGVMPVYVLYSNSENIDIAQTRNISHILGHEANDVTMGRLCGPVGPVIVTTEFDYNSSRAGVVDAVADQIMAINEMCNDYSDPNNPVINCFVAVAPRMGDTEGLDAVMEQVPPGYVHLLAFGINSHYDNATCNGARMRQDALKFARYGLYNHSLPSVIPYVLFDSGTKDATGTCTWTEDAVRTAYAGFFPKGVMELRGAGVIGIAPYDFNTSATSEDPLRCENCALGISEGRLASWYGGCQDFMALGEKRKTGGVPIIFPNESGGYCDYGLQTDSLFYMFKGLQEQEFFETTRHTLSEPDEPLFRCDACLVQTNKSPSDYFPVLKEHVPDGLPGHVDELCPDCEEPAACYIYPEIDYYSSKFNVDPILMRAIVWKESNFHPCSVAKVCRPGYSVPESAPDEEKCLRGDYDSGYNYVYDPSGLCQEHLDNLMAASGIEEIDDPTDPRPKFRFAAMGLLQTMESPYDFWPAEYHPEGVDGPYSDEFLRALYDPVTNPDGRRENVEGARACSPYFNPFNTSHAACMGARKLEGAMRYSRQWVDEKNDGCSGAPDLFEIGDDPSKRDVLAAFVAMYRLAGVWGDGYDDACPTESPLDCWARDYCEIKSLDCSVRLSDGSCRYGCVERAGVCTPDSAKFPCAAHEDDFLEYSHCLIEKHGVEDKLSIYAGYEKLGRYEVLQESCPNTFCPPWAKMTSVNPSLEDTLNEDFDESIGYYSIYPEGLCT